MYPSCSVSLLKRERQTDKRYTERRESDGKREGEVREAERGEGGGGASCPSKYKRVNAYVSVGFNACSFVVRVFACYWNMHTNSVLSQSAQHSFFPRTPEVRGWLAPVLDCTDTLYVSTILWDTAVGALREGETEAKGARDRGRDRETQ